MLARSVSRWLLHARALLTALAFVVFAVPGGAAESPAHGDRVAQHCCTRSLRAARKAPVHGEFGSYSRLFRHLSDVNTSISVDGDPVAVSITTAGDKANITFSGSAGQQLGLALTNNTFPYTPLSTAIRVLAPDSSVVASSWIYPQSGLDLNIPALPTTGTYTIVVNPNNGTGSATLTLSSDVIVTNALDGSSVNVNLRAGQNERLTFSGTAGQYVGVGLAATSVAPASVGGKWANAAILKPDGTTLASVTLYQGGSDINSPPLPTTGTYTVMIDPEYQAETLTATVSTDVQTAIAVDGASAGVSLRPGQNERATFSAAAGQNFGLAFTGTTEAQSQYGSAISARVAVLDPSGNQVTWLRLQVGDLDLNIPNVPATGTYTLLVDPIFSSETGTLTLSSDLQATTRVGGAAVSVATTRPGQNERITFTGGKGQPVDVSWTSNTYADTAPRPFMDLFAPDGSQVNSAWLGSFTHTGTTTLGTNGTYTVFIDPTNHTGSISVTVAQTGGYQPTPQTYGPCDGGIDAINQSACVDDVDTATGAYTTQATDVTLPGIGIPFEFTRSYTSADTTTGRLGIGWTDNFAISTSVQQNGDVVLHGENGQQLHYTRNNDGSFTGDPGAVSALTTSGSGYQVVRPDQSKLVFDSQGKLVSEVDRNNEGLHLTYDGSGHLSSVTDSANRQITFASNPDGTISTITVPDGRHVNFSYTNGQLTGVTDLRGGTTTYAYDAASRLTTITDQNNHAQVQNTYGADGRLTQQLDALNHATTFSWDANSQTATTTDARSHVWKDVYGGNVLISRTDPNNHTTTYSYDGDNNLKTVQDANFNTTTMTYDSRHNMTRRSTPLASESWTYDNLNDVLTHTDGRNNTTTYGYDAVGNLTTIIQPGNLTTTFAYDPAGTGLLFSKTNARSKTTSYGYDSAGDLTSITTPLGNKTSMTYDGSGRLLTTVDPRGNVAGANPSDYTTTYTYDGGDNLLTQTDPLGTVTTYAYDPAGNKTSLTDANNHTTQYGYDADNHLITVTAPDTSVTSYAYDAVGNVASRTDANNHVTTYTYDAANQLVGMADPLNRSWSYTYDADGNRTKTTNPAGAYTSFGYDSNNRLTSISYSDGTPSVSFGYDGNDNRSSMQDGSASVSYTYDALNRLTQVTRGTDSFVYTYDATGDATQRTYPGGTATTYTYDDDGNLATATTGTATTTYTYNPADLPSTAALPNGYSERWNYDRALRVNQVKDVLGSTTNWQSTYTFDPVGNALTDTTLTGVETYGYDNRDRLTSVCYQASCPNNGDPYIRWSYDPVGNRLTEIRPTGTTTYTYDAADELTQAQAPSGTTAYTYDANGNQITAGANTYTYNLASQLTAANVNGVGATYSYDGDGNRLTATTGGATTTYLWDTNNSLPQLAIERDNSGPVRTYLQALGTIGLIEGGSNYYYTHDRLGSITGLTSSGGATEWKYSYEPFGAFRAMTKVDPFAPVNPVNYIGGYQDPTTGLLDLRARQYDVTTGRFQATDPIAEPAGAPYAGAYLYGNDAPTRFIDPSGQEGEDHPGFAGPYGQPFDDTPRGDAIRSSEVERDSNENDGFAESRAQQSKASAAAARAANANARLARMSVRVRAAMAARVSAGVVRVTRAMNLQRIGANFAHGWHGADSAVEGAPEKLEYAIRFANGALHVMKGHPYP